MLVPDSLGAIDLFDKLVSEKYLDYLTKYSKGLIKFGEPQGFAMELDKVTFYKAFKGLVGAEPGKTIAVKDSLRNKMKVVLKDDAFKKVDVFYTVGPSIAPGIYTSHKMDFIGINGAPYAGLAIDLTKDDVEVDKTILTFRSIVNGISERAEKFNRSRGTYELYFNDPVSLANKNLLDKVRKDKSKGFTLLEFDKMDTVIQRLNKGNYSKFSASELAVRV